MAESGRFNRRKANDEHGDNADYNQHANERWNAPARRYAAGVNGIVHLSPSQYADAGERAEQCAECEQRKHQFEYRIFQASTFPVELQCYERRREHHKSEDNGEASFDY